MPKKKVVSKFIFPFPIESEDVWFIFLRSRIELLLKYSGMDGKKKLFNALTSYTSFNKIYGSEFPTSEKVYMIRGMEMIQVPMMDLIEELNNINFTNI